MSTDTGNPGGNGYITGWGRTCKPPTLKMPDKYLFVNYFIKKVPKITNYLTN